MRKKLFMLSLLLLVLVIPMKIQAATKLKVDSSVTAYTGKTTTIKVKKLSKSYRKRDLSWTTSDKAIATVSKTGKVKGIKEGNAVITATVKGTSVSDSCKVTVGNYVKTDSVKIETIEKDYLVIGEKIQLKSVIEPEHASYKSAVWSTSNKKVIKISKKGKITALKKGKATIKLKVKNTKLKASLTLPVKKKVGLKTITLNASRTSCYVGEEIALSAKLEPENTTYEDISWKVSGRGRATISENGTVKALKDGTVTVTAKVNGTKKKAKITLTFVNRAVTGVTFDKSNPESMEYGTKRKFVVDITPSNATIKDMKWTSSNKSAATVDGDGVVTAIRPIENVDITATSKSSPNISVVWHLKITADKGYVTKEKLDKLALTAIDKIMIVAHPDDETLWGGAHLLHDEYLVVVMTNEYNATRKANFQYVMSNTNEKYLILDYPDIKQNLSSGKYETDTYTTSLKGMQQDIDTLLTYKKWKKVVTHNPFGEYGKFHHQKVSSLVTASFNKLLKAKSELYYFGKYYNAGAAIPGEQIDAEDLVTKRWLINQYLPVAQGAITAFGHMIPYENWVPAEEWK